MGPRLVYPQSFLGNFSTSHFLGLLGTCGPPAPRSLSWQVGALLQALHVALEEWRPDYRQL